MLFSSVVCISGIAAGGRSFFASCRGVPPALVAKGRASAGQKHPIHIGFSHNTPMDGVSARRRIHHPRSRARPTVLIGPSRHEMTFEVSTGLPSQDHRPVRMSGIAPITAREAASPNRNSREPSLTASPVPCLNPMEFSDGLRHRHPRREFNLTRLRCCQADPQPSQNDVAPWHRQLRQTETLPRRRAMTCLPSLNSGALLDAAHSTDARQASVPSTSV